MIDAPTHDLDARTQAEEIIRNHDKLCQGVWDDTAPYCSCAPEGTSLCEACSDLTTVIAGILSHAEHAEADLIALRAQLETAAKSIQALGTDLKTALAAKDAAEGRLTLMNDRLGKLRHEWDLVACRSSKRTLTFAEAVADLDGIGLGGNPIASAAPRRSRDANEGTQAQR